METQQEKLDEAKGNSIPITWRDMTIIVLICLLTGAIILMPKYIGFDPFKSFFYVRNMGIIGLFGISLYTLIIKKMAGMRYLLGLFLLFAIPALFINLLKGSEDDHAFILSCIHLPLMLWCIFGIIYGGFRLRDITGRVAFIRHNCDLAVMGALIILAGMILAGFTISLFASIDISIEKLYAEYIGVWGVVAAPAVTAFIIHHYPKLTGSIAPVIAALFSPFILITLVIYLLVVLFAGKDPYTDRDFLIMFNLMLVGVMAVIVFSISETAEAKRRKFNDVVLFALAIVTMVTDLVALSAIFYRLGEFGISANRVAVLGSNILILGNLVLIVIDLYKVNFRGASIEKINYTTARYLPLYLLWTAVVVFGFPFLFS